MKNSIRIGTRSSELALWQANTVSDQLKHLGYDTEIIKIDSIGDEVLTKPLYELGTTGVFTKNLDIALLNDKIDIAVHSMKDVPTQLPKGIVQAAVLKRGNFNDVLVMKQGEEFFTKKTAVIATGSQRRKAQWLYRYPNHQITGLRGNVNTRLRKLQENDWDGAIFALAGLKRIGLLPENHLNLDWMIPAPAQGAVMVVALEKDAGMLEICAQLNDRDTEICAGVEREFLNKLEGGCSAPIGALAVIRNEEIRFKGALFSTDGSQKIEFTKAMPIHRSKDLGEMAANYILDRGGKKLMRKEGEVHREIRIFSTKNLSIGQQSMLSPNIGVDMSDFITVRFNRIKPSVIKKRLEHVVITSQNAVESLLDSFSASELDFGNIYCVGRRTKGLIEKKIGKVSHSDSSAEKLAKFLASGIKGSKVTFFCSDKRRDELPQILEKNGIEVEEVVSYQTLLTPNKMAREYKGILFFSPSGVESYLKMNRPGEEVAFCIGSTTATAAKVHFTNVIESKLPSVESVLDAVNAYYQTN